MYKLYEHFLTQILFIYLFIYLFMNLGKKPKISYLKICILTSFSISLM